MIIKCENEKQLYDVLGRLKSDGVYKWSSECSDMPDPILYPVYIILHPFDKTITYKLGDVGDYDHFLSATDFCKTKTDNDPVNHPSHYTQGNVECIDAMEMVFGTEAVKHYCLCAAFKYMWRRKDKGNEEQDKAKAEWYFDKFVEIINREQIY